MLTFENYIFNFHVWLHDLAAATPQREPAFSQARETIISIGRFTKMFNLLLNCWFHFMKHFSKPLQNARNRQNELVTGKSFWLLQWRSSRKLMGLQVPSSQKEHQDLFMEEPTGPECRDATGPECRDARGSAAFHKTNLAFEQGHYPQPQPDQNATSYNGGHRGI